jgi:predicted MPP superfamily phosphohydrolase
MSVRRWSGGALVALVLWSIGCAPIPPGGPVEVVEAPSAVRPIPLPNLDDSLKFAVLGDFGNGSSAQYQMAERMATVHTTFPYEMVILVGDNIYGSERPQDFVTKFERPYKAILDRKVKFYASLGNHDSREQRFYEPFNMGGELYYSFKAPKQNVRLFALESTYPEPEQIAWLEKELQSSRDDWKIAFFHHPLYSSAGRHGSDQALRDVLEPLFIKYNVSVVFTGHDHVYERIEPQHGISYFVAGSGGQLRSGDLRGASPLTARGFDRDLVFVVAEINGDVMTFNAIARGGQIVDSGQVKRRVPLEGAAGGR